MRRLCLNLRTLLIEVNKMFIKSSTNKLNSNPDQNSINDKDWRNAIQLLPINIYPAQLKASDLYSLLISWCNDQASLKPCLGALTPTLTASECRIEEAEFAGTNPLTDNDPDGMVQPHIQKGTVELHYGGENNYVEFLGDSDTLFKHLRNVGGDNTRKTEPLLAQLCNIYFSRNLMRFATILAFYNVFAEVLKAGAAGPVYSSGYYGNAIGDACILWLYGWGYYVYHGTFYSDKLNNSDACIEERIRYIKDKLRTIVNSHTGNSQLSPLQNFEKTSADLGNADEADIKPLLEEAIKLGAFLNATSSRDKVLERALKYEFNPVSTSNLKKKTPLLRRVMRFLYNSDVAAQQGSKIGYYEMINIAGKYLLEQRLYAKKHNSTAVATFIIVMLPVTILGALFGFYANIDIYYRCQKNSVDNSGYSCEANHLGMYLQGGYILLFLNLALCLSSFVPIFAGLIRGSVECHALIASFMRRYVMLRKVDLQVTADLQVTTTASKEIEFIGACKDYMQRDCYERYIFIKLIMEMMGSIWSPLVSAILIVCAMLVFYFYVQLLKFEWNTATLLILMVALAVWLFPLICNTYANSAMDKFNLSLRSSSPRDYSVIGGRDEFLNFAEKTPLYWYIFGFAVTPSWLAGFVGGILSAVTVGTILTKTGSG